MRTALRLAALLLVCCRSEPQRVSPTQELFGAFPAMDGLAATMLEAQRLQQRCAAEAREPISLAQAMETDRAQAEAALAQPLRWEASREATRVLAELGRRSRRPALPWKALVVDGARAELSPLPMGTVVLTTAALRGLRDEAELAALLGYAAVLIGQDKLDESLAQHRESACRARGLAAATPPPGAFALRSDGGMEQASARLASALAAQLPLSVAQADRRAALADLVPMLRAAGYAASALSSVPAHAPALFAKGQAVFPAAEDWLSAAAQALAGGGQGGALPALQPALAEAAGSAAAAVSRSGGEGPR